MHWARVPIERAPTGDEVGVQFRDVLHVARYRRAAMLALQSHDFRKRQSLMARVEDLCQIRVRKAVRARSQPTRAPPSRVPGERRCFAGV